MNALRRHLLEPTIGLLALLAAVVWLTFVFGLLYLPLAIIKLLLPVEAWRRRITPACAAVADFWGHGIYVITRMLPRVRYELKGLEAIKPGGCYLILPNHRAWTDILVLFHVCHAARLPFPRFFLKRELIWIPMIGFVCWSLDMPFMYRFSQEQLRKRPELKGRDLEMTRKACQKYRGVPVTIVNFLEGTRFTPEKRDRTSSPHRHLLRPRTGGVEFMLNAMHEMFDGIVDVNLFYPPGEEPNLVNFACGRVPSVTVETRVLPVPHALVEGDLREDPSRRKQFQNWVNSLWMEKDRFIATRQTPQPDRNTA